MNLLNKLNNILQYILFNYNLIYDNEYYSICLIKTT